MIKFTIDDDIILREFSDGDAAAIYDVVKANYDHLRSFMWWAKPEYSLVDAREFIAQGVADARQKKSLGFGIFREGKVIGSIGFVKFDSDAKTTEIGYWIDRDEEGKGIISRACKLLIDYAFNEMKLNRIEIRCSTENVRSAAIPQRFGFVREGVLRQYAFRNGKLHDFAIYGLLAAEWKAANPG